jgi:hypothetical protein
VIDALSQRLDFSLAAQEAAMDTIAACREDEPKIRRAGFAAYADWLKDNARAAERWLVRKGT